MLTQRSFDPMAPSRGWPEGGRGPLWEMRRLFDDLERGFAGPELGRRALEPTIDLVDHGDELRLYAELPGYEADELDLQLERNELALRGRRRTPALEGYRVLRRERAQQAFVRRLPLPCRVEPDAVEAKLQRGVLEVRLPKAAEDRPREIPVSIG